jgi:hypothetical protein
MKTYKKIINSPLLEIRFEDCPSSPREWSNLGIMAHDNNRYSQPDGKESDCFASLIKEGKNSFKYDEKFLKKITRLWNFRNHENKIIFAKKLWNYEIGDLFYFVTEESQKKDGADFANFEKIIEQEFENFKQYLRGEIYEFKLFNENGELEDSLGGIYNLEEIRDYLPEGWENEDLEDYLIN